MKQLFLASVFLLLSGSLLAQPTLDLGLKAGINNSEVTLSMKEINTQTILKYHVGAFGRVGFNRIFIQPEVYYSSKGGELEGSILDMASQLDFSTVDIPLLLGLKVLDGERANLRIMAGPVFSILTTKKIKGDDLLDTRYYKDNYFGFQYGIGADLLGFTLDLRMENAAGGVYQQPTPDLDGKNSTFMISVGYKIF